MNQFPNICERLAQKEDELELAKRKLGPQRIIRRLPNLGGPSKILVKKTYRTWQNVKKRCYDQKYEHWRHYGGKKIIVCERWRRSFYYFLKDMGLPPTIKHMIERTDNSGNYEPSNCKWATQLEQARNKSNNTLIDRNGVTKCISEWAEETGLHQSTILSRIRRKQDLFAPLTRQQQFATINGETKRLSEWAKISGLTRPMIYCRRERGWKDSDLLKPPCKTRWTRLQK